VPFPVLLSILNRRRFQVKPIEKVWVNGPRSGRVQRCGSQPKMSALAKIDTRIQVWAESAQALRQRKNGRWCKHHQNELEKGCYFVSCTTRWMQSHTTLHLENKRGRLFNGDQVVGRQRPPCTPPGVCSDNSGKKTTQAVINHFPQYFRKRSHWRLWQSIRDHSDAKKAILCWEIFPPCWRYFWVQIRLDWSDRD